MVKQQEKTMQNTISMEEYLVKRKKIRAEEKTKRKPDSILTAWGQNSAMEFAELYM